MQPRAKASEEGTQLCTADEALADKQNPGRIDSHGIPLWNLLRCLQLNTGVNGECVASPSQFAGLAAAAFSLLKESDTLGRSTPISLFVLLSVRIAGLLNPLRT